MHRTLADKARQDVLRSSTVRYRPTNPDFVARLVWIHRTLADKLRFFVGRQKIG